MKLHQAIYTHSTQARRQKGSVLLWGLIILLTMTIIGVTAARLGVTDTRIAGNQIFQMLSYQGAESALERVTTLSHIAEAASATDNTGTWTFTSSGDLEVVNAVGTVSRGGALMCMGQEGFAVSAEMLAEAGGVSCRLFTVSSRSNPAGTGARSEHEQGILKYAPATGEVPTGIASDSGT